MIFPQFCCQVILQKSWTVSGVKGPVLYTENPILFISFQPQYAF